MIMKRLYLALFAGAALAQDITFTNQVVTFTNLQTVVYSNVTLVKPDVDGVVWRNGASGGKICYTNLSPALLEAWGIPTNLIEGARIRAQRKAVADTKYRAAQQIQASLEASDRTNRLIAEKLRGLTEFTVRQVENFPEKIKWAERGWMDATFVRVDSDYTDYPTGELAFTVKDKEGEFFFRCYVYKFLGDPSDVNDRPPNPLVKIVMALKEGDRVRLIGSMRVHLESPRHGWFTIDSIEPLKP